MNVDGWTVRSEYVRCGKAGCRSCPHGPYWYGYRTRDGKTEKKYFGRSEPKKEESKKEERRRPDPERDRIERWNCIFDKRTANGPLAAEILGLPWPTGEGEVIAKYRFLALKHHPDRGGDARMFCWINSANEYLMSVFKIRREREERRR